MKKRRGKPGFTLVEIMIVVAIIGLLVAIAIPNFLRAREEARANSCVANLKQLEGAKERWAMSENIADTVPCSSTYLVPNYLKVEPSCPAGGAYTYGTLNDVPTCDFAGGAFGEYNYHGLPYTTYGG